MTTNTNPLLRNTRTATTAYSTMLNATVECCLVKSAKIVAVLSTRISHILGENFHMPYECINELDCYEVNIDNASIIVYTLEQLARILTNALANGHVYCTGIACQLLMGRSLTVSQWEQFSYIDAILESVDSLNN